MIEALTFYLFAGVLLTSALLVITVRNPVYSVLFLIVAFFNAAGLFVLIGAEFVAFILVIVYVGAVAVLFLFVVMMLDIDFADLRKGAGKYLALGLLTGAVLLSELFMLFLSWPEDSKILTKAASPMPEGVTNTEALGNILYTDFVYVFQIAGLVLLSAMIGAIVLTHRRRPDVRRQNVSDQTSVRREDVIEIRKVTPGTGV
jgi:NADH-quinone oxidoreductase subunit J